MNRFVYLLIATLVTLSALWPCRGIAVANPPRHSDLAVEQLFSIIEPELSDPSDQEAIRQLRTAFATRGSVREEQGAHPGAPAEPWMVLTFDRVGALQAVEVDERLLSAPPLIQRAVLLHELEHLKWAKETRRQLSRYISAAGLASAKPALRFGAAGLAASVRGIVRTLVEDECRAYRRDILSIQETLASHGGLEPYLESLPSSQRAQAAQFYGSHVQPFLTPDGALDEQKLRRDFIFFQTFPHRYPAYYEAALWLEALEDRRPREPGAFLAWLSPE